jgi:hypothetical protein
MTRREVKGKKEDRSPSSTLLPLSLSIVPLLAESQKDNSVSQMFIVRNRTLDEKEKWSALLYEGMILPSYRCVLL